MSALSLHAAVELAASMVDGPCRAVVRPEAREIAFVGGRYGEHALWLPGSDEARVRAHWAGYLRSNDRTAQPPAQLSLLGGAS